MLLDVSELNVFCQHSSCVIRKDVMISVRCIRLPLSGSSVFQRIIVLFGKHDNLHVSHNSQLQSGLTFSRI